MSTRKKNNSKKNNKKYIIQLKDDGKRSLNKTEKELTMTFTSSAELSSKVRAQDVLDSGNGLYLKNLGLVIVEDYEEKKLQHFTTASQSPIIYWEEEREFTPVIELDLIDEMRASVDDLSIKINQLEELILANRDKKHNENLTWGLHAIGMDLSEFSGKGVDVCVLDTGLYKNHPDFKNRNITGKSFVHGEAWDHDGHGHGTHCTGTAFGNISHDDNRRYGVAHEANISIAKVLDDSGSGSTSNILDAIDNCIEKGHKVISMSLGSPVRIGERPSPIFEQVGKRALANNSLIIAAAGNDSRRPSLPKPVSSPANAESIMAVAALDENLNVASFSNGGINASNGGRIDIAAPGVDVFSSYSKNSPSKKLYANLSGTSMATPHIAGIAALYWEAFPDLTAEGIWLKIEKRAKQLNGQLVRDVGQGLGQSI